MAQDALAAVTNYELDQRWEELPGLVFRALDALESLETAGCASEGTFGLVSGTTRGYGCRVNLEP